MIVCKYCAEEFDENLDVCPYCQREVIDENALKEDEKHCRHCGETIKKEAIFCRYCRSNLEDKKEVELKTSMAHQKQNSQMLQKEDRGLMWFLFSFEGRLSRKSFFKYILSTFLIGIIAGVIAMSTGLTEREIKEFIGIISLILLFPNIATTAKRAHDFDATGFLGLLTLIPYVGFIIMLLIGFIEPTKTANKYGDPVNH